MANERKKATFLLNTFSIAFIVSCRRVEVNFDTIGLGAITIPLHGGVELDLSVELESGGLEYEVS